MNLKGSCNNIEMRNINCVYVLFRKMLYSYILLLRTYKISLASYGIMHNIMFFYSILHYYYYTFLFLLLLWLSREISKFLNLFLYNMKKNSEEWIAHHKMLHYKLKSNTLQKLDCKQVMHQGSQKNAV